MISKEQIKAARAMLDWSQKTLAQKCDGVSEPTIKLIESGKVNSTETTLTAIKNTFEEAGLENKEEVATIGRRFRETVLALGGSLHPMDVFKSFRGREPSTQALLRHRGLVKALS